MTDALFITCRFCKVSLHGQAKKLLKELEKPQAVKNEQLYTWAEHLVEQAFVRVEESACGLLGLDEDLAGGTHDSGMDSLRLEYRRGLGFGRGAKQQRLRLSRESLGEALSQATLQLGPVVVVGMVDV